MPWTLVAVLIISLPLTAINYYVGRTILGALARVTSWNRAKLKWWIIGIHSYLNLLPVWISFVVMIQLLALLVLLEIFGFSIVRFMHPLSEWWHRWKPIAVLGISGFVTLYTMIVIVQDTWTVRIVRHEISLPKGLGCLSGLRIAEISDVQGDGRTTYDALRKYVSQVNSFLEKPTKSHFSRFTDAEQGEFRVLLVHQPAEILVVFARNQGYQLMLAGHTHGGGVAFGIPGLFLFAPANLESQYVSGLYHVGGLDF